MSNNIELKEQIYLDFLTEQGVSVLKQTFIEVDGKLLQVGTNHRTAYANSPQGRINIIKDLDEKYINAILAIWGDTPLIEDLPDSLFKPTTE